MNCSNHRRRGMSIVYITVAMTVLCGFASLAVDLGRVQLVKTELRQAADASARYAVSGLVDDTWLQRAQEVAQENKAEGIAILLSAADVRAGNWDATATPRFSTTRTPVNAVQVVARRTRANGNPVKLWFGSLIGFGTCNVQAVSVAALPPTINLGFIGLNGLTAKNQLRSAGYSSSSNPTPTWATRTGPGMIGSNVSITGGNNEVVGQVVLGQGAKHNLTLASAPIVLDGLIPTPNTMFPKSRANPAGTPPNLTVKGNLVLPGGNYFFNTLKLDKGSLSFSGPAIIYIDGNVELTQDASITAYQRIPANLWIRQRGAGTIFGGSNSNNFTVVAEIDAPQTDLIVNNNAFMMGRATFNTIVVKNNAEFLHDHALQATLDLGVERVVSIVQ